MATNKDVFLHKREGESQSKRFLEALAPENLELNDFKTSDWVLFAYNFAKYVNFFDTENTKSGDWQLFFGDFKFADSSIPFKGTLTYDNWVKDIESKITEFETEADLSPHLTLFISFVQLLEYSKERFNNLTKRHLDFYLNEVLNVHRRDVTEDSVYLIFQLAQKAIQEVIPVGTQMDAGRDKNGKRLIYETEEEVAISKSQVVALKSVLMDAESEESPYIKVSPVANSLDGLGEELPEESQFWWPFGYPDVEASSSDFIELQNAKLGFAIASPVLNLKEGNRTITLTLEFKNTSIYSLAADEKNALQNSLKIQYSSEEEWVSEEVSPLVNATNKGIQISFQIPNTLPVISPYNQEVHTEKFNTDFPVIRFSLQGDDYFSAYTYLVNKLLTNVKVTVLVSDVLSLEASNDSGTINSKNPFTPFSNQPTKGSNFQITIPEISEKKWSTINAKIYWKNTPDSFSELYKAYKVQNGSSITRSNYNSGNSIVTSDSYFKAALSVSKNNEWIEKNGSQVLFKKEASEYVTEIKLDAGGQFFSNKLRLTLNQSFLQEVYPTIYTLSLLNDGKNELIPNQPYVPLIERIELSYTATEEFNAVDNNRVAVFQEDVFGRLELKEVVNDKIVPTHTTGGEFYIGLSALPGEQVSLLIKTLEGSENPLVETFEGEEAIQWEILSDNTWLDLSEYIIADQTINLLKSGIFRFNIPSDLGVNSTILPNGTLWIRALSNKSYDAVCKIQNVFTQVSEAKFVNNDNDISHLENGLPDGTISKMLKRIPKVKEVKQPYESFGGIEKETDEQFYRRISERLRHKNRAVTQWDYEHLILQEFPEIYNVKCLNHTSQSSYEDPGNVTLIVIPNTKLKNSFDIYQPRVSRSRIKEIGVFINELTSIQVATNVINPEYEEIEITVEVKFYEKFDAKFYSKKLDEDLKKYFSPWAFDNSKEIVFDVNINRNMVVNYMERLAYVDYINNIKIRKEGVVQDSYLITSDPRSIIVSAKQHHVTAL